MDSEISECRQIVFEVVTFILWAFEILKCQYHLMVFEILKRHLMVHTRHTAHIIMVHTVRRAAYGTFHTVCTVRCPERTSFQFAQNCSQSRPGTTKVSQMIAQRCEGAKGCGNGPRSRSKLEHIIKNAPELLQKYERRNENKHMIPKI